MVQEARPGVLPSGSRVELMVLTEVSSARAKPGDLVKLRVQKPLLVDGAVAVPVGTPAFGVVEQLEKSGSILKAGEITVSLTEIQLGDRKIRLSGAYSRDGKGGKNDDAVKAVLVPLYALFAPGNSGKLKAGELLTASVDGDYMFGPEAAASQAPAP